MLYNIGTGLSFKRQVDLTEATMMYLKAFVRYKNCNGTSTIENYG
jgi:hypothetical protein